MTALASTINKAFVAVFVAYVLAAALVPAVRAGELPAVSAGQIVACDDVSSGNWEIDSGFDEGTTIYNWGATAMRCYGTRITGLSRVRSFTLWLRTGGYVGTPTVAVGAVYSGADGVVASADVSSLLPTTNSGDFQPVTADFGSMVTLNTSLTYILAFCATGGGSTPYVVSAKGSGSTYRYCSSGCETKEIADWTSYLTTSMRTKVIGSCSATDDSPASQLAPLGALAQVAALLTLFWH